MEATCQCNILSGYVSERTKEFHEQLYYGDVCGVEVLTLIVLMWRIG